MKRYMITIQHEIIVYAYNPEQAQTLALKAYSAEPKCIAIKELPDIESEALALGQIIDNRKAPGQ
jgi:hypothetical protein